MKPVTQTEVGIDNPRANCLMACVASILEVPLSALPDLYEQEQQGRHWFEILSSALATYGMRPVEGGDRTTHHIVVGASPRSSHSHAVVGLGEAIVHDPHPTRAGIVGPATYWISLVPLGECQ